MSIRRRIDRIPKGNPLFCEITAYLDGEPIRTIRTVYSESDTDESLLKSLRVKKADEFRIKILIEWINEKVLDYEND